MSGVDPSSVFSKFIRASETDEFAAYEKELVGRISTAIYRGYVRNRHEPEIVEVIDYLINSLKGFSDRTGNGFRISTKSLFIHGYRSMVEFMHNDTSVRRELGDIVFIFSIVYNGDVYFERVTINQVKKGGSSNVFHIDAEQLFLLSSLPKFRGVTGSWVGQYDHSIPNFATSLGSYGLIYKHGFDFAFINAADLSAYLAGRNSVSLRQAMNLGRSIPFFQRSQTIYLPDGKSIYPVSEYRFASNTSEFISRFLRFSIGEISFISPGWSDNPPARSIRRDLIKAIKNKSHQSSEENIHDALQALEMPYAGFEETDDNNPGPEPASDSSDGPGIGLIYVSLTLEG